jgi:type IV pilus assembly protein PilN
MKITLNLASRPYADLGPAIKRLRVGLAVLGVICLGLAFGLHLVDNKAAQARAREHSLDGKLTQVQQERESYLALMQRPENAKLLRETDALNQIIDAKAFSWTLAMESLETVLPGGVQVTTLEPARDKDGHITLHLRVVGPQNLSVDLVRNLERSKRFLQPRIVGENAEESSNGANQQLQPVSASNRFDFDLLADYNPPTAEERKSARSATQQSKDEPSDATPTASGSAPGNRTRRLPATNTPHLPAANSRGGTR